MTIIAAYKDPSTETYWIASDSDGVANNVLGNYGSKLLKYKNYTLGFSSSYLIPSIIKEEELIPKKIDNLNDLRNFRDCVHLTLEENHIKYEDKDQFPSHPIDFLIITKFGIYILEYNYQLLKCHENYNAIGAGEEFGLGSLYTSKKNHISGKDAVKDAVRAAVKHSTLCGGRVYYLGLDKEGKFVK